MTRRPTPVSAGTGGTSGTYGPICVTGPRRAGVNDDVPMGLAAGLTAGAAGAADGLYPASSAPAVGATTASRPTVARRGTHIRQRTDGTVPNRRRSSLHRAGRFSARNSVEFATWRARAPDR